jgi:polyhydroxyalkanoate synthesis repressor PhaR
MTEPQPASKEPKVIKRYTNRKLYDTVESRYVTLDEIAEMVKQGVEVKIVDNRTKEDLTSVTLAQIVFEEEKKKSQMPLDVLREIIRRPGNTVTDFFKTEVSPRVQSIREEAESRLDRLLHREDKPGGADGAQTQAQAPSPSIIQQSQKVLEDLQKRVDDRVKAVVDGVVGGLPALGRDMQALIQRIEQMEKKIEELEKKR